MRHSLLNKYKSSYLNHRLIFVMDVMLSTLSTAISALCISIIVKDPEIHWGFAVKYIALGFCAMILAELLTKAYRYTIRHMAMSDLLRYVGADFIKEVIILIVLVCLDSFTLQGLFFLIFDFLVTIFLLVGCRVIMILVYKSFLEKTNKNPGKENILIFGVKTKAASLVTRLSNSVTYNVCGFISPNSEDNGNKLCDKQIYYFEEYQDFLDFTSKNGISSVLFAHERDARAEADGLVRFCYQHNIKVLIAPSVDEVKDGRVMQGKVRQLRIEDLLGRDEIKLNMEEIRQNFSGKTVMVTGAAGSIGSELVRQLAGFGVGRIILFDNAETPLHNLRLELEERFPKLDFVPVIGDVRLAARLDYAFRTWHPQIVFHAAAYKHVPLMEENPCEAVLVNVAGTRNVADKCIEYGTAKMVMISTDKAVNPTNIMGCTKRLAEIYVQSLGLAQEKGLVKGSTEFVTTRFGNVLGSNGSVIPRFRDQIEMGGPVTVTHPEINRFFMTIPEACRLVMEAATLPHPNRIYVFDMGTPVKIDTLARRMIELAGFKPDVDIKIIYTGLRPGEKLYEEVLATSENTEPTSHDRIKIAHVREYEYENARSASLELERLSRECTDIPTMVRLMKAIVPEFKSENSRFGELD